MAGCCGSDCNCGPCSTASMSGLGEWMGEFGAGGLGEWVGEFGAGGLGAWHGVRMAHASPAASFMAHRMLPATASAVAVKHAVLGMHGLGQTTSVSPVDQIQTQLTTLWNDLQATKVFGIGLGFILVGTVIAFHFKKRL